MAVRKQYHFIRPIASGGFGDIYLCEERSPLNLEPTASEDPTPRPYPPGTYTGRKVVLKILKSKWSNKRELVSRLRDEGRLLRLLNHRNIVEVHALTSIQGRTALVMEYLEAVDVSKLISMMREHRQRIPLKISLSIVAAVADALDCAYNIPPSPGTAPLRVIHRDIKPGNIMLNVDGLVKVLDFGVAQSEFNGRESSTREMQFGSSDYMAPERLFFEPETPASDVYSLSATLFEMISTKALGKALAFADRHKNFIDQKVQELTARLRINPECTLSLQQLLVGGLSHAADQRLDSIEFSRKARVLAGMLPGPNFVEWSSQAIPHFLQQLNRYPMKGGVAGQTYSEDHPQVAGGFDDTLRQEADTGAIRRGARAELKEPLPIVGGYNQEKPTELFHGGERSDVKKKPQPSEIDPTFEITLTDEMSQEVSQQLGLKNSVAEDGTLSSTALYSVTSTQLLDKTVDETEHTALSSDRTTTMGHPAQNQYRYEPEESSSEGVSLSLTNETGRQHIQPPPVMVNPRAMADSVSAEQKFSNNEPTGKTIVDGQAQALPRKNTNTNPDFYSSSTDVRDLANLSFRESSSPTTPDRRKTLGKRYVAFGMSGFVIVGLFGYWLLSQGNLGTKAGDQAPESTVVSSVEQPSKRSALRGKTKRKLKRIVDEGGAVLIAMSSGEPNNSAKMRIKCGTHEHKQEVWVSIPSATLESTSSCVLRAKLDGAREKTALKQLEAGFYGCFDGVSSCSPIDFQ